MIKRGLILSAFIAVLSGCDHQGVPIDQESLCEVRDWQKDVTAASCKAGQKVVFLPDSFGNEQLPVIFAAVNCDHRFNIALTKGGVSCIYSPLKAEDQETTEGKD
ncbi:hypothetical protein [Idiomarina aminovorans]|uniref:hypothetical protein n=1 Tax=Idiomarina aminovorans TaxID=2914829 RepID=UPI00200330CE|nr:hypothetical protein [Idiomarina sp. ATCH4]MCK7460038.1 hypothetical protein [Idiomarina sp. ATCH4]